MLKTAGRAKLIAAAELVAELGSWSVTVSDTQGVTCAVSYIYVW